ncbi:MAG: lipopolysaccharide kinase InaA family protein, partial [Candidatus Bathyarchaeia archaeon]
FADTFNPVELTRDLLGPTWMNWPSTSFEIKTLDPKRFLTVPTHAGLVVLSNQTNIEEFVESNVAFGKKCTEMRKIGGVLNNVYLLKFIENGREQKVVAKKFEEWANLKWLALAAWSIGTQNFSVRAKTRLARECSSIQFLKRWAVPVPDILHISWEKSLLILQFIEGNSLDKFLVESSTSDEALERSTKSLRATGELLAHIHAHDFSLGDFKPENVIADSKGVNYIVDLEQAGRKGNKSWDVGEFAYYSAHLASVARRAAKESVKSFLEGYLDAGGAKSHISRIVLPDYVKIFAPIVYPPVLYDVSRTCANLLKRR